MKEESRQVETLFENLPLWAFLTRGGCGIAGEGFIAIVASVGDEGEGEKTDEEGEAEADKDNYEEGHKW